VDSSNTPLGHWAAIADTLGGVDALYEFAPVGLCVLDTDLRYLRINRRLAEINGLPIESHLGRAIDEVLPSLAPLARDICARILATAAPVCDIEFSDETPAAPGQHRVWRDQWWPMMDRFGRVAAIAVSVEDVTAEKQIAEALRSADRVKARLSPRRVP